MRDRIKHLLYESEINKIVADTLKLYGGGKEFFDSLDSQLVKNDNIIMQLFDGLENEWVVATGKFGDTLYSRLKGGIIRCNGLIVFNGGMCSKQDEPFCYYPYNNSVTNREFIFVDDSLFSGGTAKKINEFLQEYGSRIDRIKVIYDGSKIKSPNIESLYRYYK